MRPTHLALEDGTEGLYPARDVRSLMNVEDDLTELFLQVRGRFGCRVGPVEGEGRGVGIVYEQSRT
jgi:hypothetical protein